MFKFSAAACAILLAPSLLRFPFLLSSILNTLGHLVETSFLSPSTIRVQWFFGHSFLLGNALARRGERLIIHLQLRAVSHLLNPLFFFSRIGGVRSYLNFSTHRSHRAPYVSLSRLSCSLSFSLQQTQPAVIRPATFPTSFCAARQRLDAARSNC